MGCGQSKEESDIRPPPEMASEDPDTQQSAPKPPSNRYLQEKQASQDSHSPMVTKRKKKSGRKRTASEDNDKDSPFESPSNMSSEFLKKSKDKMIALLTKPALVHQVKSTAVVVSKKVTKGAHHLKNIFAAPLEDLASFRAPTFVKEKEDKHFLKSALRKNFVFADLSKKELKIIIDAFEKIQVVSDQTVIQQGDAGDFFYVIKRGKVRFEVNGLEVGHAERGNSFGELALLYTCPRAASAIAEETTDLYRVDQRTFRYIMQSQTLQTESDKKQLLQGITFLKNLDQTDIEKLINTMVPRVFEPGDYIVRKGDEGDIFYVIQEGDVKVTDITLGSRNYEDQVLGPGDYFGERALATKEPRSANCIAASHGIALSIDKETFEKVIGSFAGLALKSADKRKLSAIKLIQMTRLPQPILTSLAAQIFDQEIESNTQLIVEGQPTRAALYLVRSGKVHIVSQRGDFSSTVEPGGYFGEDLLEIDMDGLKKHNKVRPRYSVWVKEGNAVLGVLPIEQVRKVTDTTRLGKHEEYERQAVIRRNIDVQHLKKHAILGSGTFGQVWLVSTSNKDGEEEPFALKIQSKAELLENHQARSVVREKDLMQQLHHPFVIELVHTYQDPNYLYMLLGIVQGGELLSVIHRPRYDGIREKDAKFYAAGILESLSHMHRRHIIYRDLKPENVLIDSQGYPVIVDLGFAKYVPTKTYTLCGTPLYIAPEVILNRGHDKGADHWSYGVLTFEMIVGQTPFFKDGMDQMALFRMICRAECQFPAQGVLTADAEDLLKRIFVLNPAQRLGSLAGGIDEIFDHPWYSDINFVEMRHKDVKAPWIPEINDPLDRQNFENWDHLEDKTMKKRRPIPDKLQEIFKSF